MVEQNPIDGGVQTGDEADESFLPHRAQPFQTASFVFGVPGAILSAIATTALVVFAHRTDVFLSGLAVLAILGGYLGTMGVLWIGIRSERAAA